MQRLNFKVINGGDGNKELDIKSINADEKSSTNKGVDEMKNIYKRKDGRWEYSKLINGERIYFISKFRSKIEQKVKQQNLNKKQNLNLNSLKYITEEWYNNFKKSNLGIKAQANYNNTLNNYIIPKFGKKNIRNITYKELQLFINTITKRRTQELIVQHLKAIFNYAQANRYIQTNPTLALTLPKNTKKKIIKPLTIEEQKVLLQAIHGNKLEIFILFSIILGTRRNETLDFKIEDIDQAKQTIHIRGTKTENSDRYIKISKAMITYLLGHNKKGKYFNFTSDYVTKNTTKILKSLNINKSLHSLRHTTATNLYYLGWKDKERQQYLGHANIITTNNVYTYLENDITAKDIKDLYGKLYYEFDDNFDDKF